MAVLDTEEEEEDMVEEDLDTATRVGAMEVVMTTMEEVTYWFEMTKHFSCKSVQVVQGVEGEGVVNTVLRSSCFPNTVR